MAEGDSVIFFNFRPDRAREITRTFVDDDIRRVLSAGTGVFRCTMSAMTQYDATMPNVRDGFPPQVLTNTLGRVPCQKGQDAAAHCRDGEICPRNLLLQRRRGRAQL